MDNLIDNYSQEYKENLDNYKKIIRDLGFTKRYHSGTFEKKTDKKHIYIDKFDPDKNTVEMRVTPIDVGFTSQSKYKHIIDVNDIVNYVQSDELDFDREIEGEPEVNSED